MKKMYTSPEWELRRFLQLSIVTVSTESDYKDEWDQYEEDPASDAAEEQA